MANFGAITTPNDPRIPEILDSVCQSYGIGRHILFSKLRSNHLLEARLIVIGKLRECRMSYEDIGLIMHRSTASVSGRARASGRIK